MSLLNSKTNSIRIYEDIMIYKWQDTKRYEKIRRYMATLEFIIWQLLSRCVLEVMVKIKLKLKQEENSDVKVRKKGLTKWKSSKRKICGHIRSDEKLSYESCCHNVCTAIQLLLVSYGIMFQLHFKPILHETIFQADIALTFKHNNISFGWIPTPPNHKRKLV